MIVGQGAVDLSVLRYLPNVVTLRLLPERCVGCGLCATVCPHRVFVVEEGRARIRDRDACMECGACTRNCPVSAVEVRAGVGCAAKMIFGGGKDCDEDGSCCG